MKCAASSAPSIRCSAASCASRPSAPSRCSPIGHDLRTPLARLQLRLDGVRLEDDTRAELEHDIGEMRHLLESLQAFVEAGGSQIPPQRIDIAIMATTLVDSATDQGLDAHYDGPESCEIMARAVSIRRALANLIDNALHYAGNVRVSLRTEDDAVVIRVEDDGPGIPEDRMEDVFQPFFRLDTARSRDTPGMGLGLSIVQAAVRLEGGTLALVNKRQMDGEGTGLVAVIRLPLPSRSIRSEPGRCCKNIAARVFCTAARPAILRHQTAIKQKSGHHKYYRIAQDVAPDW